MPRQNDASMETRNRLKEEFNRRGLDPSPVWEPDPDDPQRGTHRLTELLEWVDAYRACPDRHRLAAAGFVCPPVDPDVDPDNDWLRFERWLRGEPLGWRFQETFGAIADDAGMTDEEVEAAFGRIVDQLAQRAVTVSFQEGLPARLAYRILRDELSDETFDFLAPNTFSCVDGCAGCCPECRQRPWCADGQDEWPEDDDVGQLVVPEEAKPFLAASPFMAPEAA